MLFPFIKKYIQLSVQARSGFTLVEILVASAIFSFIVITATGALTSAQGLNAKLQQSHVILDGVNLSMETMVRDIRYGHDYHCAQSFSTATPPVNFNLRKSCVVDLTGGVPAGKALIFAPVSGVSTADRVAYYTRPGTVNGTTTYAIYKATCAGGTDPCTWQTADEQITGDDVNVEMLSFFVAGANTSRTDASNFGGVTDRVQPMLTVLVSGQTIPPTPKTKPVSFRVQESVTSRVFDF